MKTLDLKELTSKVHARVFAKITSNAIKYWFWTQFIGNEKLFHSGSQKDSTEVKVIALRVANLGLIPGIVRGLPHTTRSHP